MSNRKSARLQPKTSNVFSNSEIEALTAYFSHDRIDPGSLQRLETKLISNIEEYPTNAECQN